MNIPNFITLVRVLLVPLLVIFLLEGEHHMAFLIFLAAGFSDALDGFLARLLKQKSALGAFIDPIADKLLLNTTYITLAVLELLPNWLAVLVVSRDVIILVGLGILMFSDRHIDIKPTFDSKITTFMQLATICFFLGIDYVQGFFFLEEYLLFTTAFFTILSGSHYLILGFRMLGTPSYNNNN